MAGVGQTVTQGTVDLNTMFGDRARIERSDLINRVHPDNAPYFVLFSMLQFEPTTREDFSFLERDDFESTIKVSANAAAGAATLVVDSGDQNRVVNNQMLYNPRTGEHFFVLATPTTTTISVEANWPDVPASGAGLIAGDSLYVAPTAMEYGSKPVDTIALEPTSNFNYVEMNRKGWKVDGRAQASAVYGPSALDFAKEDNIRAFMREQEIKNLFGVRGKKTVGGKTVTSSGGIKYFMDQSGSGSIQRDFSGTALTKNTFDNYLQQLFEAGGSRNRMILSGWNLIRIINGWGQDKLTYNDRFDKVGLTVRRYESDFGVIDILPHKLWSEQLNMNDEAWVIDLDNLKRRGLPGRSDITLFTTRGSNELQDDGEDAMHMELWVEDGMELRNRETFSRMTGISA